MMNNQPRLKYPLTENAKDAAKMLVNGWQTGQINQHFHLIKEIRGANTNEVQIQGGLGVTEGFQLPKLQNFLELSYFNLVSVTRPTHGWDVLLMQELINAVESDFAVSDYFLTTQAVGTIISSAGSITITGTVAGAASIYGNVSQTVNELAQHLRQELGDELLKHEPELKLAIEELEVAVKQESRLSAAGKVILELGAFCSIPVTHSAQLMRLV